MTEIHLTIERLVLDVELGPGDADRVVAAMQAELSRILSQPGRVPDLSSLAVPALRAPDIAPGAGPAALGRDLARSLARSLGGDP